MPRGSSRTLVIPDYKEQLKTIKKDPSLCPTHLTSEIESSGKLDLSPRGIARLERSIAKSRERKLFALARHLGVDPLKQRGWFTAFEALAQATLHVGCLLDQKAARKDGARLWTEADNAKLQVRVFLLKRSGKSDPPDN